jgi:hypothetical protein
MLQKKPTDDNDDNVHVRTWANCDGHESVIVY